MVQTIVIVKGRRDLNEGPALAELSWELRAQEGFTVRGELLMSHPGSLKGGGLKQAFVVSQKRRSARVRIALRSISCSRLIGRPARWSKSNHGFASAVS